MAVPSNTALTYTTDGGKGRREDLSNMAHLLEPDDRPFLTTIGRESMKDREKDWIADQPDAVDDTNAALEGDDSAANALVAADPYSNVAQIFKRIAQISGTQMAIARKGGMVGQLRSMGYEVAKKSVGILNSVEKRCLSDRPKNAGAAGTAREMAGALTFIKDNWNGGGGSGAAPTGDGTDAPTDGTQREFTEAIALTAYEQVWRAGAKPRFHIMGAFQKKKFSTFQGVALKSKDTNLETTLGKADIFITDFGDTTAQLSRYIEDRSTLVYDPAYWKLAELRGMMDTPLAKNGDSERREVLWEDTLMCGNPEASASVLDLTTS